MITVIIILITTWGCIFLALRNKNLKSNLITKIVVSLAIALTCAVVYLFLAISFRPSGPFEPLATTDYFFDKPNTRELTFTPKFFRNHEIAIISTRPFPVNELFNWKARVQVYRFGIKLDDHELRENSRTFVEKSQENCKDISFGWIRTLDLIPGKTIVRITVDQGDSKGDKYSPFLKVAVRPSPII
jgi:hypothetical protein